MPSKTVEFLDQYEDVEDTTPRDLECIEIVESSGLPGWAEDALLSVQDCMATESWAEAYHYALTLACELYRLAGMPGDTLYLCRVKPT
jgi:hypothetical protein